MKLTYIDTVEVYNNSVYSIKFLYNIIITLQHCTGVSPPLSVHTVISAGEVGETSITVSWTAPLMPNGVISHYQAKINIYVQGVSSLRSLTPFYVCMKHEKTRIFLITQICVATPKK